MWQMIVGLSKRVLQQYTEIAMNETVHSTFSILVLSCGM